MTTTAYESPRRPKPDPRDMAIRAIRILDALRLTAWDAPIEMTDAAELALDVLMKLGIAVDHQAGRFVEAVTTHVPVVGARSDDYMRQTNMEQMIFTWQSEVRKRDRERTPEGEAPPVDPFR